MKVEFDRSFEKSIRKLSNRTIADSVEAVIQDVESAKSIEDIRGLKKLTGHKDYYRIRKGDFRIGFRLEGNTVRFIIVANRKDIYRQFP